MKASRDKTLISGERTTREPSTMHERTNEGFGGWGMYAGRKTSKTMTIGNKGKKRNNRYRSEREGTRHGLSARRGGVKVA